MKSKTGELILLLPVDAWPSLPFRLWCERHSVAIEDVAKRFTHTHLGFAEKTVQN